MLGKGTQVRLALLVAALGCVLAGHGAALAGDDDDPAFEVVDPDGIYYGSGSRPKTPGEMTADDVWAEIPEYKKIVEDDLDEDDPEYHLLLAKATERFNQALKTLAKRDSYDMLGEVGAIVAKGEATIPDVTKDMIKLVTRG
jgi:hypothetical protein